MASLALRATVGLALEPPLSDGGVKTARKGIAHVGFVVHGHAAHAGIAPEAGVNAALAASQLAIAVADLADHAAGTMINIGRIVSAQQRNVVAEESLFRDQRCGLGSDAARA